jgi:hypothetical protein
MSVVESSRKALLLTALLILVVCALVVSGIRPYDRPTWLMEVALALIATRRCGSFGAGTTASWRRFARLSRIARPGPRPATGARRRRGRA